MFFTRNKLIIFTSLFLIASCSSTRLSLNRKIANSKRTSYIKSCDELLTQLIPSSTEQKIKITKSRFLIHYNQLNNTLSGNLATVFRSEWKSKENYLTGANFLDRLILNFDSGMALKINTKPEQGLTYFKKVIEYISNKEQLGSLGMRDPPAPIGSFDKTFTYYTKTIIDSINGKHQVRVRRYVRQLIPEQMKENLVIPGFKDGKIYKITKIKKNQFKIYISKETSDNDQEFVDSFIVNSKGLTNLLGDPPLLYSFPHGKKYKLEIKSRPHDLVRTDQFLKLNGTNYVQKLSINIDDSQLTTILNSKTLLQLAEIENSIIKNSENSAKRTTAIFNLLRFSIQQDQDFLVARGATQYERFAFAIKIPDIINGENAKVQVTFDFNMGIRSTYSKDGNLLSPIESIQQMPLLTPKNPYEEMHIELKVPKILVERVEKNDVSLELLKILNLFNELNVTNKGKFFHITNQRDIHQ